MPITTPVNPLRLRTFLDEKLAEDGHHVEVAQLRALAGEKLRAIILQTPGVWFKLDGTDASAMEAEGAEPDVEALALRLAREVRGETDKRLLGVLTEKDVDDPRPAMRKELRRW